MALEHKLSSLKDEIKASNLTSLFKFKNNLFDMRWKNCLAIIFCSNLYKHTKAGWMVTGLKKFVNCLKVKIILQIVISVVWLTNFLSEIQSLINPWWWGEHLLLSMKRYSVSDQFWTWVHWWLLASWLVQGVDGEAAVWVVQDYFTWDIHLPS